MGRWRGVISGRRASVPARVDAGRAAQVDPADGRAAAGRRRAGAAAVRQPVAVGYGPVRRRMARRMRAEIEPGGVGRSTTPGFPKDGPLVGRRWRASTAGRWARRPTARCGVSSTPSTDTASCPLDWRLFVPEEWDDDAERRAQGARSPTDVRHREKWRLALDMLDELGAWGLVPPVVRPTPATARSPPSATGLEDRGLAYVVQVKSDHLAYPHDAAPRTARLPGTRPPAAARATAQSRSCAARRSRRRAGRRAAGVTWREGSRGRDALALRGAARPARQPRAARSRHRRRRRAARVRWLLAEWPAGEDEPDQYWLSNLPAGHRRWPTLVRLAKLRWRDRARLPRNQAAPSAWTTSRAAPSAAGTTTSPASPSPTPS